MSCFPPRWPALLLAASLARAAAAAADAPDPALAGAGAAPDAVLPGVTQRAEGGTPLTLDAALRLAERDSPMLAARQSAIEGARAEAVPAGALPDPRLVAGLDNFPVTGTERGLLDRDFMTMQRIGVMQEVPNSAKRRARTGIAEAEVAVREADIAVARSTLRREAALAWLALWSLQRRLDRFDALARENRLFAATIAAQVASGRAEPADGLAPAQEATQLADRRDALEQEIARARASLRRYIGAAADRPLAADEPLSGLEPGHLRAHLEDHPELRAFAAASRRAEAELAEAQASRDPDWAVEVAYQRRGGQFGDMVSLQFSFDLPIARAERQDPRIAARRSALAQLAAEREAARREHASELEGDLAEWNQLGRQIERARTEALPLAERKVDLLLAAYGAGKARLAEVLQARRERVEQQLRVLELEGARLQAAARLVYVHEEAQP